MRIVITGASGFLGGFVANAFTKQRGAEVIRVSRRDAAGSTRVSDYSESPGGDVLIHLAQWADRAEVNATSHEQRTAAVDSLRALARKGYSRLLLASSGALYGDAGEGPHRPGDPPQVSDAYARLKLESERVILDHGGIAVRLANVYGPGQHASSVLATILSQIPGSGPLRVFDTRPVRDFLWVEDAAEGFAAIASSRAGSPGGVVNLGTGVGTSIGDAARTALQIAGEAQRVVLATSEQPRAARSTLILDYSETEAMCGWRPRTAVGEGLARLLEHKRSN